MEAQADEAERYPLGLCLSGGGYRAMLFHAGSLARLNDAGLLSCIDMISSVSGGSMASGLLAYVWQKLKFEDGVATNFREEYLSRILSFSQIFADAPSIAKGIFNPFSSAAEEAVKVFEARLLDGSNIWLKSLPQKPWFVFCSSNLSTGSLFRMSNRYVADYRVGYAPKADLPLATAIAASAAFPPVLSPLRIDLSKFEWKSGKIDTSIGDPVPPGRAVLTDGGVYDNHGIEPTLKRCDCVLVSDAGAPWEYSGKSFWNYISQLRRVLDTTDNQVRSLRRRTLVDIFTASKKADEMGLDAATRRVLNARTRGVYWSISSGGQDLSNYASFQMPSSSIKPAGIGTYLHFLGTAETEHLINWGYYVCDSRMRQYYPDSISAVGGPPIASGTVKPSRVAKISKAIFDLVR
nr:patatin-like phospholipase family protein [Rhizobium leguminosarum]